LPATGPILKIHVMALECGGLRPLSQSGSELPALQDLPARRSRTANTKRRGVRRLAAAFGPAGAD